MKIRDLGKAFLDLEISTIPKAIGKLLLYIFVGLPFLIFCGIVHLYKQMWPVVLLASVIIFFGGVEVDCREWCYFFIEIYSGFFIEKENFYWVLGLLSGLATAFVLDKKLAPILFGEEST